MKDILATIFLSVSVHIKFTFKLSRVQIKSWSGKALETVNCCAFLKRRLIGAF
jgi:hypothetical protein